MANIDVKYELWKNKLLDLGKRNRLLNYRETARSSLKIEYPECDALWDLFVKEGEPLIFPFEDEENEDYDGDVRSNVRTNKSMGDLQKTLRNLRGKAKTAVEEQGVNVLYLSFGFLTWTEADHSDQAFVSPLILVPVSLTVESINAPYVLNLHEDEITVNPTLVYKLENDFGITLPEFNDADDIGLFLDLVKSRTALRGWSLSCEVGLSLLSFLKINMYADLNAHKDAIVQNPIVRAISGDASAVSRVPDELQDFDFDRKEKPLEVFQVVDADASQQDAILMAKRGVSFVLQGPPGTGKSQTITNIIAESLAAGKKVLFVSEKMAALDVVHRRLTAAGLEDFCLVLHSHKANKRSVLDQLDRVLKLGRKKATMSDEAYQKLAMLQDDKQKLNEYARQVYEPVEPLGKSIYEVNGIIADLESYDDYIFAIDDVRYVSKEKYHGYVTLLSRYATTVGKMSNDFANNPWRGCKLSAVTNEFRHDSSARLGRLLPQMKEFDDELGAMLAELHLDLPHTVKDADRLADLLDGVSEAIPIPSAWILTDEIQPLYEEVEECAATKRTLMGLTDQLVRDYEVIQANEPRFPISSVSLLSTQTSLKNELHILNSILPITAPYSYWQKQAVMDVREDLRQAREVAERIQSLKAELLQLYEPTVFDIDYRSMLARIKTEYTSFMKIFKKTYKQDKKTVMLHHRSVVKKVTDEEMLALMEKLRAIDEGRRWYADHSLALTACFGEGAITENTDYDTLERQLAAYEAACDAVRIMEDMRGLHEEIEQREELLQGHYQFLYNGILSNWDSIREALDWAVRLKALLSDAPVSDDFVKSVCRRGDFIRLCEQAKDKIQDRRMEMAADYSWFIAQFDQPESFDSVSLTALYDRCNACTSGLSLLEEWIDYSAIRAQCVSGGLEEFISIVEEKAIPAQSMIPIFNKRFFRLWLDAVLFEYPAVLNFRRKAQDHTIAEFAMLDKVQFDIAKARIQSKLINDLPSLQHFTSGVDEISILNRELKKQRRIMPIRRLFKEIPNLLLTLKPCLMMSPLSVSLFLEAETYKFDIVIFDEASQVCTENAIGAISRAKQVVIAGDSKQLPPTNFFQATVSDGDYDDTDDDESFDDTDAYESILDEANMLPERTLRWHYRSRHESLIAFSNAKIYQNNLITFPSNIEHGANIGVEYVYVPTGFYDRGGKKGNIEEANKVADLVFKHFRENPHRSLGVIAFGETQQQAIETVIRERRLRDRAYEPFFAENREEAFFVKNLENVQGDERDTIIFSIGYAKDKAGVFRMNFGPLSKSGGERRLNVAVTRAKYNVKLVGSIMPTDIQVEKISSEGPKLLRSYIEFAMNGQSVLDREITEADGIEHDSPFEEAVYKFLDKKGYSLGTQIGCSGYRIDMAVKHPTLSGIYVLGIECDGAAYHSARTARERDRLRQDVLENMGWKIYRVWSTDWIKDPITEGAKLVAAVEEAIAGYGVNTGAISEAPTDDESDGSEESYVTVTEDNATRQPSDNPYGFEPYRGPNFAAVRRNRYGYREFTDCIMEVVETEYPVHFERMCQQLAPLLGNEKATVKVRRDVEQGLSMLGRRVIRKGDYVYPAEYKTIPIRLSNNRKIQHISKEELAEAMYRILQTCVGTTREALSTEAARVYGFTRTGPNISTAMSDAVEYLIKTKRAEELEGKLRVIR